MEIKNIEQNRDEINEFIKIHWFSTDMVIRGEIVDMTKVDGFAMYENEKITGLITYRIIDSECEITSLDSLEEKRGIGTALINKVRELAVKDGLKKLKLITTNDNINALRFYQKYGFDMARLYHNSMEGARKLKPAIPLIGDNSIPLRHEIEFEINL